MSKVIGLETPRTRASPYMEGTLPSYQTVTSPQEFSLVDQHIAFSPQSIDSLYTNH